MIGLNIQTSFLTPPFGFALFYLRGVAPAVVRTVQMYKGVIAFILLQLLALGVVGKFPELVNYLPNRVSYLSDTAPPPRNPKLQLCLEEYVGEKLTEGDELETAIARAKGLDLSVLPKDLAKDFSKAVTSAETAIAKLDEAFAVERTVAEAAIGYRPLQRTVRQIEKDIRRLEDELKDVRTRLSRLHGDDQQAAKSRLEGRQAELEAEIARMKAEIPAEWDSVHAEFAKLVQAEMKARQAYRRSADDAYEGAVETAAILKANRAFTELEQPLRDLRAVIEGKPEAEAEAVVNDLSKRFGKVEGADDVKKLLSKARRALKSKTPDKQKALALYDEAVAAYEAQKAWRGDAAERLGPELEAYVAVLSKTLGLRQQPRMPRELALYMASCMASHRDISLNF
ncbi:TRAP transporter large permease subunit [Jhaorihella thermophila]